MAIAKGSLFCLPQHLASSAADVFGRLAAADRLRGLNRERFIGRVAEFLADINVLQGSGAFLLYPFVRDAVDGVTRTIL